MEIPQQKKVYKVLNIKHDGDIIDESIGYETQKEDGTTGYMDLLSLSVLALQPREKVQRVGAPRNDIGKLVLIKISPYDGASPNGIEEIPDQELRRKYIRSLLKHRKITPENRSSKVTRVGK